MPGPAGQRGKKVGYHRIKRSCTPYPTKMHTVYRYNAYHSIEWRLYTCRNYNREQLRKIHQL